MTSFRKSLFNLLNSQRYLKDFTPEELERTCQQYRDSIGLSEDLKFGAEAFDTHAKKRIQDHAGFKTQIGPEKEDTLAKILQGDDHAKPEIREKFKQILEPQDFYKNAQEAYKEEMEFFHKKVNKIPAELAVEAIQGYLETINARGRRALEAQQKQELTKLEAEAPDLAKKIGGVLGIAETETAELTKIQDNLINDLKKSHSEQLAAFNKTATANENIIHKAAAAEQRRIMFTGWLENTASQLSAAERHKMNDEIGRAREEAIRKRYEARGEDMPEAHVSISDHEMTIGAVHPEDLDFFISITGKKIHQIKGKDGEPGLWTCEMSPRILSPLYYLFNEKPTVDMTAMCQAVRASGFDSVTLTLNFDDPETLKTRAKEAYRAALKAGFDPAPLPGQEKKDQKEQTKGIQLINGKTGEEINPRSLFTDQELQEMHAEAKRDREKLKKIEESPPPKPSEQMTREYRNEITKGKDEARIAAGHTAINQVQEAADEQRVKSILGH